jgi:hypothetical protein
MQYNVTGGNDMTLTAAYGRDYKSAKAVKADFDANKDFVVASMFGPSGRYINKQSIPAGTTVNIRYNQLRSVVVVKVK